MPTPRNATDTDIIAMLRDGYSNLRISRELRCDKVRVARLRTHLGLPQVAIQPLTLEQKWASKTRPVDGGHLEWTGERAKATGTPLMRYKEAGYSPAGIAFEQKHGRPPQGYVKAECDYPHCVAPDHVNDEAGRQQARQRVRAERGLGDVPARCVSGHDLAVHAKFESDGTAYCGLCKALDKRAQRDPSIPRPARRRLTSLEEAFNQHAEPIDGGHVRWIGSTSHTTPSVWFGGTTYSAYKVAFRLHHGRNPEGTVTSGCDVPHCVAGAHVEDRPMRERRQQEERQETQLDRLYAGIFGSAA
ncbi:hypothetical protein G9272_32280 [Streptomyces asoensis]|uniref:Uncharacterized protein n=1 Tax=Streptomyces asoensis TaxID=249586 RepID=A0A6M4WV51_9ACTN|nr:hypothetical protein [Streptomyces asoensis]QJT04397.1 hypothetical protein G9272_32280 [Streptomyces asoensis]